MIFSKIDKDGDGKLTKVEILAFLVNLIGPYVLIIGGIIAPVTETIQTMIVGAGLGGVGMTRHSDCKKRAKRKENYLSQYADNFSHEKAITYDGNGDDFNGFY